MSDFLYVKDEEGRGHILNPDELPEWAVKKLSADKPSPLKPARGRGRKPASSSTRVSTDPEKKD